MAIVALPWYIDSNGSSPKDAAAGSLTDGAALVKVCGQIATSNEVSGTTQMSIIALLSGTFVLCNTNFIRFVSTMQLDTG